MKSKHQSSLTDVGKVFLAVTSLTICSPIVSAYANQGVSQVVPHKQIIANESLSNEADNLPEPIKVTVLQDISQRTGVEFSDLSIIQTQQHIWPNSCLGLTVEANCTPTQIPGWQVIVTNQKQVWVYRTDESGTLAKLDEDASEFVKAMSQSQATASRRTTNRIAAPATPMTPRPQLVAVNTADKAKTIGFSLAILQSAANLPDIVARVSFKAKRPQGFLEERFLGDYQYKVNHKAKFVKELKIGDRIVVRLYDLQNRFLGYSEFELLSTHTAVNLILPDSPIESQVVRTVYGVDTDEDNTIDPSTNTYDYFTQANRQQVTFLSSSQTINVSQFQPEGFATVPKMAVYPASLRTGAFALMRHTISVVNQNLAEALNIEPGRLVELHHISDDDHSIFNDETGPTPDKLGSSK